MKLSQVATSFAESMYGGKGGLIWCDHKEVSILGAALANSLTVDALDMHDSAHNAKGHAGVALVPAALLLTGPLSRINGFEHISERDIVPEGFNKPITGEELITTLVIGTHLIHYS